MPVSVLLVLEVIITSLVVVEDTITLLEVLITSLVIKQDTVTPLDLVTI